MRAIRKQSRAFWLCVVAAALSCAFLTGAVLYMPTPAHVAAPQVSSGNARLVLPVRAVALPGDAPVCTATQSRDWVTAESVDPPAAARVRPEAWLRAHDCAPASITQIARPPDAVEELATIVGPATRRLAIRRTSHMIWNGVPGRVVLTPVERARYRAAAAVAATQLAACCTTVRGPAYNDKKWHCAAYNFKNDFYSITTGAVSWSISSYLAFCSIASSAFGGVVEGNIGGLPANRVPTSWATCVAYNYSTTSRDPDMRGCWGPMGNLGFARRWNTGDPSDTSVASGYSVGHQQTITDVYNPYLVDRCFVGQISSEFHVYANHLVNWGADLHNAPAGAQWCPWHK